MSKFSGIMKPAPEKRGKVEQAVPPTPGRGIGKRTDPNYTQITAYIRRATHQGVKIELLKEGKGRDFSELVEELLADWLKKRA